jgi:succinyl-CoA synthetase beta subunit
MNIHEYQAKEILKGYGVRIQEGIVIDSVDNAISAAEQLKAQLTEAGAEVEVK